MVPKLKRTLYLGLGCTGFKTLLHTKRAFIETYGEVPPMIKFLAIDSEKNQCKEYSLRASNGTTITFDPSEASDIRVRQAQEKISRNRADLTWLPDRNLPAVVDLENGCGMVRTNGRIAFSFNYTRTKNNIQNALNQVRNLATVHNDKYELLSDDVEVNIVFSIAGGTGSGNFIDIAYLVKDIFREQALPESSKIVGYMVLPDVYDAQLTFGKERLFPNAYGSLVDLDFLMHQPYDSHHEVNYLTERRTHIGTPYNSIIAISNRNHNGSVINHSDHIAQMVSMAMVVCAGELSSGIQSVANNLERDMNSGDYDIGNKKAIIGTLGMSEITFRASELSLLYSQKAAREIASNLLQIGSNVDIEANAWIDTEQIRENNQQDQVIDRLLPRNPKTVLQEIYDKANPMADINNYRLQTNVAVNVNELSEKVEKLEQQIKESLHNKIQTLVNTKGPVYAQEFISQVRDQIELCVGEMREELNSHQNVITARESAIRIAIEEYKTANGKFFWKESCRTRSFGNSLCCSNKRRYQRPRNASSKWCHYILHMAVERINKLESQIGKHQICH